MKKIVIAILALSFFLFAGQALGSTVRLAWDHSAPETVAGYRLHFGSMSGVYTQEVDVGNVLT